MKVTHRIVFSLMLGVLFFYFFSMHAIASQTSEHDLKCHILTPEQVNNLKLSSLIYRKLKNGLRIYILETHDQPIFSLRLIFDVGAADENKGESGYAHLFEHMMFKGSKNVLDGGHFAAIRQVGGQVNASTDYDKTVYWTEAPITFLDRTLWLEAERLQHLSINELNLENQKQAVLEEKLLRIDNVPYFKIASEFMISAWQGTDYDHLIIGTESEIKNATAPQVQAFFNHYYRPENAILVLVGDVNSAEAADKIEHYFSSVNNSSMETISQGGHREPPVLKGKSETHFDPLAPFPLYALGWHTPGKRNSDFYAVELLADILFNHEASRLKYQLKEEQALVFETIGFPLTFEQAGITAMGMVPHSYADFSQIKELVRNELQKVQEMGVTQAELCSAKKHRQLLILDKMSNNRELAELIGDGVLFFDDPVQAIAALNAYQSVDNEQIKAVAQAYFDDDWLALEIVPGPGVRFVKWLMEILPRSFSQAIEQQFI